MIPLSNDLLMMTASATASGSASAHTQTGALPGPTPIAGVPELYAARTMPAPPVARMNATSEWRMNWYVVSRLVRPWTHWTRSIGAACRAKHGRNEFVRCAG